MVRCGAGAVRGCVVRVRSQAAFILSTAISNRDDTNDVVLDPAGYGDATFKARRSNARTKVILLCALEGRQQQTLTAGLYSLNVLVCDALGTLARYVTLDAFELLLSRG